jgi:hypothetical protein
VLLERVVHLVAHRVLDLLGDLLVDRLGDLLGDGIRGRAEESAQAMLPPAPEWPPMGALASTVPL